MNREKILERLRALSSSWAEAEAAAKKDQAESIRTGAYGCAERYSALALAYSEFNRDINDLIKSLSH